MNIKVLKSFLIMQENKNYKQISFITPEFINQLVEDCGFDHNSLRGGDFEKAQKIALEITENHDFRNKITGYRCIENIKSCKNMTRLYTALFNIMSVMTNPSERINKKPK